MNLTKRSSAIQLSSSEPYPTTNRFKANALAEQFISTAISKDLSDEDRPAQSRKLFESKFVAWLDQLSTQIVDWQNLKPVETEVELAAPRATR